MITKITKSLTLGGWLLIGFLSILPVTVGQGPPRPTAFTHIPQLIGASTTNQVTNRFGPTYHLRLETLDQMNIPLARIRLVQIQGVSTIRFIPEQTRGSVGSNRAIAVTLLQDEKNRTTDIILDPPIGAAEQLTIELRPFRNPRVAGTYQFSVTAIPDGDGAIGNQIGVARLQFFNSSGLSP
ncbi:DUF2808 domain-containing protein [Candidatus Synechococcus calcipolaris G9]|uniref:DUF2808 domain-containing protein n=1 Tax=Candidatus Synechococcus calcipolaris G9 TaxID=1497997 RepID=A0ABT6F1R7_9SYNE|nr:DUF2808 domain-containing protein [Candidatus Synechococcus calcipolaris]MDG2991803.1 DUF2808 domain-containing protein [Candidatus Synechococcus calcipolaris G9]